MKYTQIKRRYLLWCDLAVAVGTIVLVGAGLWLTAVYNNQHSDKLVCKSVGAEHQLNISNDAFSTPKLTLKRCDTIKIVNSGTEVYELAFGVHEKHIGYPGFAYQTLRPNEYIVIDAIQAGTYSMHDHIRDKASIKLDIRLPD